jgi:hypothetical protein
MDKRNVLLFSFFPYFMRDEFSHRLIATRWKAMTFVNKTYDSPAMLTGIKLSHRCYLYFFNLLLF